MKSHRLSIILSALALLVALSGVNLADAAKVLITGKQIRDGSLTTQDYRNGSVRSTDVKNGSIDSPDIGANEVHPSDLGLPEPQQEVETNVSSAEVGEEFALLDPVETYAKVSAESVLEVTWTGSASAGFSPCQFQLRADGHEAEQGAGTVYVANGSVNGNVTTTALFPGLPAGPHDISIFARSLGGGGTFPCTIGPSSAKVVQTIVTAEQTF